MQRPGLTVCLLALAVCLAACEQPEPQQNRAAEAEQPAPNLPRVPVAEPPLDRAGLLGAIADAASASAAGIDDAASQRPLDGRPFELRIRFGCRGPVQNIGERLLGWSYDPEERRLRVRAMPSLSGDEEVAAAVAGEQFEAVEGFWIPRPWLLQPACPAAAAVAAAAATDAQTAASAAPAEEQEVRLSPTWPKIGIAQFFSATDARTRRRSMRPYETVRTIEPEQPLPSQGFDLVLSGRLRALPDRRVIACVNGRADAPPDCIVSAVFDRVWIEQAGSRDILAEWGSG